MQATSPEGPTRQKATCQLFSLFLDDASETKHHALPKRCNSSSPQQLWLFLDFQPNRYTWARQVTKVHFVVPCAHKVLYDDICPRICVEPSLPGWQQMLVRTWHGRLHSSHKGLCCPRSNRSLASAFVRIVCIVKYVLGTQVLQVYRRGREIVCALCMCVSALPTLLPSYPTFR